jgi:hypothetical protein
LFHERLVCWVVEAEERSVVNADTVGPEVHGAADARESSSTRTATGSRIGGRVSNDARGCVVASESLGATTEVVGSRWAGGLLFVIIATRTRRVVASL